MTVETALAFLREHLPADDLSRYPRELFEQFADHALMLRKTVPWCRELEEEIFCHYVLTPRVNDEDLSFHRELFYNALWPRVCGLAQIEDVVLEVNRWCHEIASYELTDERTASPLTVYRCGKGRCGEESAFLVSALRSVGVPARQVYVPRWSHCDDNHAWVEVLCGGRWRFLGACEPEPVLDRGWFNAAASRAVLVRSRLFGEGSSALHGELIGREGDVWFYNQTARYAPVSRRTFTALLDGKPAAGARFQLQILNESSFHTAAALMADEHGQAQIDLGAGTVHVLASLGELRAEVNCGGESITLDLSHAGQGDTDWVDFDFHAAPVAAPVPPLDADLRSQRAKTRWRGTALRAARLSAFFRKDPAHPEWDDLLRAAGDNCGELLDFLRGENAPARERLLRTLAPKDLRDTPRAVLEDHFTRLPPRPGTVPEEVYWRCTACPRIALEKLVPWRSAPELLCGDSALVADLRSRGVPARLRPLDGAPEVWENGAFRPVFPEETGILRIIHAAAPVYRVSWTLSRRVPEGWKLMDLSDVSWEDGALTARLPAGQYRLVTANRLPGGDQFAAFRDLPVLPGETRSVVLRVRECALGDMLFCQELPALSAVTPEGGTVPDIFRVDKPTLFLWLEEGAEPTEHVLRELTDSLADMPADVAFLLRSRRSLDHPAVRTLLARWPRIRVLLDDWSSDMEDLARLLNCDPDTPPLAVVCDSLGRAVYAHSGYRVGLTELLTRIAGHIDTTGK